MQICLVFFSVMVFGLSFLTAQTNDHTTRSGNILQLSNPDVTGYNPALKSFMHGKKPLNLNYNKSEIIFSEDFDGIPGIVTGGAGTYAFPSGWLLVNVDGRTPATNVSYINDAWERREDFNFNVNDSAAFSTSWYTPAGAADDWMISPAITLDDSCILKWNAVSYDPAYPDGYQVRISTTTQSIAGCNANPVLFSITAENSVWTERSVSLAAYSGQIVYIAFRNNSNDKFLLLIDDIVVERVTNIDAEVIKSNHPFDYSKLPVITNHPLSLGAAVKNNGTENITNVILEADVYQSGAIVQNYISTPVSQIAPGDTHSFFLTSYIPSDTGDIIIIYKASMTETDADTSNNFDSSSVYISADEMARDDGISSGILGIGAGNGGELGVRYELNEPELLKGIKFYIQQPSPQVPYVAFVRSFENGKPGNLIARSDTLYVQDNSPQWIYAIIQDGPAALPADTFVVTINEIDSTLTLGLASNIFTENTNWVNWPTSPFGDWAPVENFGSTFSKAFMIRPVFEALNYVLDIDGDLSDPEYKTIGTKLNNNNGFGSSIDISNIKVYPDTLNRILYLGIEGRLPGNFDGIGLWLNFNEVAGVDTGQMLGGIGSHYMGQISFGEYKADFEVDYMFALYTGGSAANIYINSVGLAGTRRPHFLGSTNHSGSTTYGPGDSGLFSMNSLLFAFDNSGSPGKGFEIAFPFSELGITNDHYLEAFAFLVSQDAYFSNVTIPGNITGGNLGYNPDFNHLSGGPWHTDSIFTAIEEEVSVIPYEYSLLQNYPNPFNPETIIKYSIASPGRVIIKLYNILGSEVRTLVNETKSAGAYELKLSAYNLPSGVYIYKLQTGEYTSAKKMILMK